MFGVRILPKNIRRTQCNKDAAPSIRIVLLRSTDMCLGVSNGEMPGWFKEAVKSAVVKKANDKRAAEKARALVM